MRLTPPQAARESSSGVVSSLQLKPAAPDSRRRLIIALFIVAGIAATHVGATQASQYCVLNGVPPFFSMWFSTGWNVLLALPLLRQNTRARPAPSVLEPRSEGHRWAWPTRLVWRVVPFYSLWAGANTLYVAALGRITSSLTTALFSVTPALVVLLAVPLLGRRLTPFSVLACALAPRLRDQRNSARGGVVFLFYSPLYNSTQNTAGAPQRRTPLQIVCAPAPVRIRRPSSIKRRPESLESEHRSSKSL